MNRTEAQARFAAEMPVLEHLGLSFEDGVRPAGYLPDEFRRNLGMALDAEPGLTTDPNAGIPSLFTTWVDPKVYEVLFAKNKGAEILGEVRKDRCDLLRKADWIVIDEIKKAGFYDKVWQSFAVLLPVQSVGVMGDERTYENAVAVRAVTSQDGMTADWAKLPPELLGRISNRIINEVRGINRVCYDISSKPPATIEWE